MSTYKKSIFFAILAASFYGLNAPLSKLLLENVAPTLMASSLYLGAGIGMSIIILQQKINTSLNNSTEKIDKKDYPYVFAMIVLDMAAPISLMYGLSSTAPENVSLLNNFEIVTTSLIALIFFKEKISNKLWSSILLVTIGSILLSLKGMNSFNFSWGSILVIIACFSWGVENNCTRRLSIYDSKKIVAIKGLGSGLGSLIIGLCIGETIPSLKMIGLSLFLGFVAYGLSINYYVLAQKNLGAAKTSAYYSMAPFLGVIFSFIIFQELPNKLFWFGLLFMLIATYLLITDTIKIQHSHSHTHKKIIKKVINGIETEETIIYEHNHIHPHNSESLMEEITQDEHDHKH